ncbi:MAG: fatty acid desaturase family protein [Spirochaetes bacterium]|nr:fatty acid desaturase family protein [Spirochaetota bacterium]
MKPKDILSADEMARFLKKSDFRGFIEVATSWGLIAASFAIVALWPHLPTIFVPIIVALVVLGNRHLALAILVHDACHHALFKTKWLNEFMAKWFCAAPVLQDLEGYRKYHLQHHKYTGEDYQGDKGDPDIILTRNYPISKKSLRKWLFKDLSGRSAPRLYLGLIAMNLGLMRFDLSGRIQMLKQPRRNFFGWMYLVTTKLFPFLLVQALLFTALYLVGQPWLYLLWIASGFTTFQFFTRIRSIAEHGMLPRVSNMLQNTRTTEVSWWERLTFAPCHVNYHLEHHFLMAVPSYRLPELHRIMKERGVLDNSSVAHGYGEILRLATTKA